MSGFVVGDRVVWTQPPGIDNDTQEEALIGCEGTVVSIDVNDESQPYYVHFEKWDDGKVRATWWCTPDSIQKVREDEL